MRWLPRLRRLQGMRLRRLQMRMGLRRMLRILGSLPLLLVLLF